jgi:hypothetical protein
MLVSSTSMNVAMVTTRAMIQGLCFGFQSSTEAFGDSNNVEFELIAI